VVIRADEGVYQYLRTDKKFPLMWCSGCGNGIVMGSMLRAIDALGLDKNKIAVVSGIGCSGRASTYVDFNTLHTTHGRALTFATGLKLVRPELTVLVVMGDGDALAIGGNHFIHAARRNLDLTAIIFNNYIYGMTGGQISPTTPQGMIASTARAGNIEASFDVAKLAEGAGASFVARGTSFYTKQLDGLMEKAIHKKGFSVVDVITQCPPIYGRYNRLGSATDMMKWQEESALELEKAEGLSPEELEKKFLTGVFIDEERPEYSEEYDRLIEKVRGKEGK
jgi:2-oxoglutarate ferredoxin oxidoreductase subunit beta